MVDQTVIKFDPDIDLGPWEQGYYGEFDGQRAKRVLVKVFGL